MNIKLEDEKRESQLFIQAIQTGDPKKSLDNLCVLLNFGLIKDPENKIQDKCKPIDERPPSLPSKGKYEEVPNELRKYARAGGQELPGLRKRREAEIELWNTR